MKREINKITKAVDLDNKKIVYDGCMITVSGIVVNLLDPDPDTLLITDIAHGLANNCRWNGHTRHFWSVAQHCCMMYDMAPKGEKLSHLFHDAEEAYWGDMIKPLKNVIRDKCPEIIEKMKMLRGMIYLKFNISPVTEITMINDFGCLQWEFENIIKVSNCYPSYWSPIRAKQEWIERYESGIN